VTPGHIAIIGGGYSGALQAINLLRFSTARVTLIEKAQRAARGAAYSTRHADHLLNVRADGMSAFADDPGHFAKWLARDGGGEASSFAQRRVYGRYLEELLGAAAAQAGERLRLVRGQAVAVTRSGNREVVALADGGTIEADRVILSVGNLPPETPRGISPDLGPDVYVADPWAGDITAGLGADDRVLLIGTGLTAVDAALMLDAAGFEGAIVALSRRGLVPRAHDESAGEAAPLAERPEGELGALLRWVRQAAGRTGWRDAVDSLRAHTQPIWASAPLRQREQFLRHLRPYWDVHRHRIAPSIAERIRGMEAAGRLQFRAGRIVSAHSGDKGAKVVWRPRGGDTNESLSARRVVNCTGPQGDVARAGDPLLAQLLKEGRIRADPCRIGIDIDAGCRTLDAGGASSQTLYAVGPMTRGALWEIVAVPDLRVQTHALARQLGAAA
jgi:uncharacterized NAD(P)/FAD-binding protein YdhS